MNAESSIEAEIVDDDILVIKLRGSLDASNNREFEEEVKRHLEQGHAKIIIDCASLGFVSSLGIGSLVALQAKLRKRGGTAKLAAIQGTVAGIMKTVRIEKLFDMYGDTEFARKSFYA